MILIYSIIVTLFAFLTIMTSGETHTLFLGLEIGVLIGQIIYFIDEIRRCK